MNSSQSYRITTLQLAYMASAALISLRGLAIMAKEGMTMFFYIALGACLFLLPAALVCAELGSAFSSNGGGIYTWVKEAFNKKWGFAAIWLQWIQNVIWYPTILAFAAAAGAYMIGKPTLANNGIYICVFSITIYWISTLISFQGPSKIAKVIGKVFLLGTILPGVALIILAIIWLAKSNIIGFRQLNGNGMHNNLHFFPHVKSIRDFALFAGILLLFAGVEVHTVYIDKLKNPQKQFPRAILFAAVISLVLLSMGSLSITVIVPSNAIQLESGLMQAFKIGFEDLHLNWLMRIFCALVMFGVLGSVLSWISGPSRALLWTANEGHLSSFFTKINARGVQINILYLQGIIVTLLSGLYLTMKDVNVIFFFLTALTIGLYLIMYMIMYIAGIKLRYSHPNLHRAYKVPGGNFGMWLIGGIGFLSVLVGFIAVLFPPSQLIVNNPLSYVFKLLLGVIIFFLFPFFINRKIIASNNKHSGVFTSVD